MRCKAFGVLVLLTVAAVARPQGEAAKKDLKDMEGTWTAAVTEFDGKKADDSKKPDVKLTVKGDKYTIHFSGKQVASGTIKLDAGKTPKQIDVVTDEGEFKGKTMTGIYEIKGDTMLVCFAQGKDRPTEFRTKEGSMQVLITYKRVKQP
jgi:uncharacterized protein (TIGR03067 family)